MTKDEEIECLKRENVRLLENLADLRSRVDGTMQCVEEVAIGQQLECIQCGKFRPCMCQDAHV